MIIIATSRIVGPLLYLPYILFVLYANKNNEVSSTIRYLIHFFLSIRYKITAINNNFPIIVLYSI